jgi:hypothetical protein
MQQRAIMYPETVQDLGPVSSVRRGRTALGPRSILSSVNYAI